MRFRSTSEKCCFCLRLRHLGAGPRDLLRPRAALRLHPAGAGAGQRAGGPPNLGLGGVDARLGHPHAGRGLGVVEADHHLAALDLVPLLDEHLADPARDLVGEGHLGEGLDPPDGGHRLPDVPHADRHRLVGLAPAPAGEAVGGGAQRHDHQHQHENDLLGHAHQATSFPSSMRTLRSM